MATAYERPRCVRLADEDGSFLCDVVGRLHGPPVDVRKVQKARRPRSPTRRRPTSGYRPASASSSRSLPTPNIKSDATIQFVRMVRKTFQYQPEIFEGFKVIMMQLQEPDVDHVALIKKVILLFNGYPELIQAFKAFIPSRYHLEFQEDAVVIRVLEESTHQKRVSCEYSNAVKKAFGENKPRIYQTFIHLVEDFNSDKISPLSTIKKLIILFKGHPNLVLGFNDFLPESHRIHMYNRKFFTVAYVDKYEEKNTIEILAQ